MGDEPIPLDHQAKPRTANATEAVMQNAAVRAIDDPVKLARAARIVRTALERQRLTLDDVLPADRKAVA